MESEQKESPEWNEKESELLHHDDFVSESLKRRMPSTNEQPKPWWQRFLESAGGVAVITVLLTGTLGQCITSRIQEGEKEREFQQAWIKARGDQALVAYKEYLDGEQEIVKRAYELIGSSVSASDNLISLTELDFNPFNPDYDREERKVIYDQRTAILDRFNDTSLKWNNQREQLGLLMQYYHKGDREIANSWHTAQESLSKYIDCARNWEHDHRESNLSQEQADAACKDQEKSLDVGLSGLSKSIDSGRRYAWEGWESPESIRSSLEPKKQQ
jgi:hypothetical protein